LNKKKKKQKKLEEKEKAEDNKRDRRNRNRKEKGKIKPSKLDAIQTINTRDLLNNSFTYYIHVFVR